MKKLIIIILLIIVLAPLAGATRITITVPSTYINTTITITGVHLTSYGTTTYTSNRTTFFETSNQNGFTMTRLAPSQKIIIKYHTNTTETYFSSVSLTNYFNYYYTENYVSFTYKVITNGAYTTTIFVYSGYAGPDPNYRSKKIEYCYAKECYSIIYESGLFTERYTGFLPSYLSFTNFSINYTMGYPITIKYTLNRTETEGTSSGNNVYVTWNNKTTAYVKANPNYSFVFANASRTVSFIYRDNPHTLTIYNGTDTIIYNGNTVYVDNYTIIFSKMTDGNLPFFRAVPLIRNGTTTSITENVYLVAVYPKIPALQVNSYTYTGHTILVDGTIIYPQQYIILMAFKPPIEAHFFPYYFFIMQNTFTPIGSTTPLQTVYFGVPGSNAPVNTTNTRKNTTIVNSGITTIVNPPAITYVSTESGTGYTTFRTIVITHSTNSITLLVHVLKMNSILLETTATVNTLILIPTGSVDVYFSNDTLVSPKRFYYITPMTSETITGTSFETTYLFPPEEITLNIHDTVGYIPTDVPSPTGTGTYTISTSITIPVNVYIVYRGHQIVAPAPIIIEIRTIYTVTDTQQLPTTTSTTSKHKIFGITFMTPQDNGTLEIINRGITITLWFLEALILLAMLYYSYRYATSRTDEEREKYKKRIIYTVIAIIIIFFMPRILDWVVGA